MALMYCSYQYYLRNGFLLAFGQSHVRRIAGLRSKILLGITTFCIGYAIAPMLFAPFSEIKGRYPVFLGAGVVLVSAQICCATTGSYFAMLFWRFWTGVGSSVFSTVAGGVVSDLYQEDDRSSPMALFAGASTFGMGLGPLVSGLFANWRWVFWVQVIMGVILVAALQSSSKRRGEAFSSVGRLKP